MERLAGDRRPARRHRPVRRASRAQARPLGLLTHVRVAHTADLDRFTLDAVRALLVAAFEGDFGEHDWEHCLGGMHALAYEDDELTGHAALVQRRLLYAGRALRTGYVEGLAVRADRRGAGHASALMDELERLILGAYDLGALSTTDAAARFYARRTWRRWQGPTAALAPDGVRPTPDDDGSIYVLPVTVRLDPSAELACDWRDGDVW